MGEEVKGQEDKSKSGIEE
jgi:hypothetical protein